jgi:hypothetical protein
MFRVPSHPAKEVPSGVSFVSGVRLRRVSSVSEFSAASVFSRVSALRSASEFQLRQSPRMALGPTLQGLKRAAEARKLQRIAGRLAALAGAKPVEDGAAWVGKKIPPGGRRMICGGRA